MALPPPRLYNPQKDKPLLEQITQIHIDCITKDGQLLSFIPPLDHDVIHRYWLENSEKHERDHILIIVQMSESSGDDSEGEVAGVVFLAMSKIQTGPFRAEVCKLIVSPRHRRKGVARRLMEKLEEVAREKKSYLVMLDTRVGSTAEAMYPRLGYTEIGVIPKYGVCPLTGELVDEKFYYKDLRDH